MITFFALVYTIIIMPLQLSFWSRKPDCEAFPSQNVDMFVDVFFLARFLALCRLPLKLPAKLVYDANNYLS